MELKFFQPSSFLIFLIHYFLLKILGGAQLWDSRFAPFPIFLYEIAAFRQTHSHENVKLIGLGGQLKSDDWLANLKTPSISFHPKAKTSSHKTLKFPHILFPIFQKKIFDLKCFWTFSVWLSYFVRNFGWQKLEKELMWAMWDFAKSKWAKISTKIQKNYQKFPMDLPIFEK